MSLVQWKGRQPGRPHVGWHLCRRVFVHTGARVQLGTRVISTNGKAVVSSQPHHREREARRNLNDWTTASPAPAASQ